MRSFVFATALIAVTSWGTAVFAADAPKVRSISGDFIDICLKAQETNTPPRDLAEGAGFSRQESVPDKVGSHSPFSGAWRSPEAANEYYVVSTVVPPPASPYSCSISAFKSDSVVEAEAVKKAITSRKDAYAYNAEVSKITPELWVEKFDRKVENAIYSVMLIRDVRGETQAEKPNFIALAFCAGCSY